MLTQSDMWAERRPEEDPFTGISPSEEVRVDVEVQLEADPPEEQVLATPASKDHRLSRIPCEALFWSLVAIYGPGWVSEIEPEVIVEDFLTRGVEVDAGGFSKLMALRTLLIAPEWGSNYYTHWKCFLHVGCSLVGRPVLWEELSYPSPIEAAVGLHIAQQLRPQALSPQVQSTIAAICLTEGLWVLPGILNQCQDVLLEHCSYLSIPVTRTDVSRIEDLIEVQLREGKTANDIEIPDAEDQIVDWAQTVRVLDHSEKVSAQLLRGERAADKVWDAHGDLIRRKLGKSK
jgi:hypothetical protein